MNKFEAPGGEMPEIETGSRPGIDQEVASTFDPSFENARKALKEGGAGELFAIVEGMTPEWRKRLENALNENGYDWGFFGSFGAEHIPAIRGSIDLWTKTVADPGADARSIRAANKALIDALYDL